MPIDCVIAIRDESGHYFREAYVTLLSLFDNTKEPVRVHILHDATIHYGREHLENLGRRFGQEIVFHRMPDFDPELEEKFSRWFNLGSMYRCFAADYIQADKAVYCDCDVIVNRDIKELYDVPLGDRLLAAARDHSNYWKNGRPRAKYRKKIEYLNLKPDTYIGAGVMLLNLSRLRELNAAGNVFVDTLVRAVDQGIVLDYPDQDVINAVCASAPDSVYYLDDSFNFWNGMMHLGLEELRGTMVHYNSKLSKPDKSLFPAHLLYWKYYSQTPFADDMFERMDKAFSHNQMRFLKAYVKNTRHRRHATDLLEAGFSGLIGKALRRLLGV